MTTFFSWKLGRVAGIDLYLHPTFLLLLLFVGMSQGGLFAVLLVVAVFGCVLLHELGHALTARAYGIRTEDITLYPIGGVARLARMPRKPGAELLITLAGPAVNLGIAAALALLLAVVGALNPLWTGESVVPFFLAALMELNLLLAVFNMIPAFPMDGGRVLRASLSGWLGRLRATEIAVGLGRMLALGFGVYALLSGSLLQVILAAFVYLAGQAELAHVRSEEWRRRPPRDPDDQGIRVAPPGHRWVPVGQGAWRLVPVVITVDGNRSDFRWMR